jgi:trimeric autotransporter adhesin
MQSRVPARLLAVPAAVVALVLAAAGGAAPAAAASGDIGYQDQSYAPLGGSPTGTKPESRLWFNNGWWASMFNPSASAHHIFKLNTATGVWTDTGVAIDSRDSTRADTLWDPANGKLYVASHVYSTSGKPATSGTSGRLYRYSYNVAANTYSLDPGFPVNVNAAKTETLVIDRDSTGTLWATWTQESRVYVNHTLGGNDASWGTPYIVPGGGTTLTSDDISSLIHFGGTHIGVMWSNQVDHHFYFAVHDDGSGDGAWSSTAVPFGYTSDDHVNLKTDSAGRVYAAVKTGETVKSHPLNVLLVRAAGGTWSSTTFGTVADSQTRPIVALDEQHGVIHMFATCPQPPNTSGQAGGDICEKTAPMSNPVFPPGIGTPVIRESGVPKMNDATTTKQNVNSTTGLVVLANNATSKTYWHMQETLSGPGALPPNTNSGSGDGAPQATPRPHARRRHHIRLTVRPRHARAGHPVRFTFAATVMHGRKRVPVQRATIHFAGHTAHTGRHGRASMRIRLRHGHRYRAVATKRGLIRGSAIVRGR